MKTFILILGLLQALVLAVGFLFKQKKHFLIFLTICNLLLLTQYICKGLVTEMLLTTICIIKCICFYIYDRKNLKPQLFVIIIFETILLVTGIFTFKNWTSIFVLGSSMIGTYASWQSNMLVLRILYIISSTLLILNFCFTGLYTSIIAKAITLTSNIYSLFKYHIIKHDCITVEKVEDNCNLTNTDDNKSAYNHRGK